MLFVFRISIKIFPLSRMSEWMDNVDKAIGRIMADKVYTSAEFKRERDTFHVREIIRPRRNEATYIKCIIVGAGFKCKRKIDILAEKY